MLLSLLAIIAYLAASYLLLQQIRKASGSAQNNQKQRVLIIALAASVLHGIAVRQYMFTANGTDIGFFTILSLVGWMVSLLLVITATRRPVECLGIIVFPFTAITAALRELTDQHHYLTSNLSTGLEFHILISILAYSMLSIAVVQAILLYIQEAQLHNKHPGGFIRAFPPLETMETLLFRMIGLGFIVLTVSLVSGYLYLEDMLAQHLVHKTILSVCAWALFAILLWGRVQFGWRGRTAIRWTISGFIFLMLAYFGSKFVIELVLNR